ALPLLPLRLYWRARREPGYGEHVGERFGRYVAVPPRRNGGRLVWIHAVSVGETRAIAPLVERLRACDPAPSILLTHMTATGRETGRALFGDAVTQAWLPYDIPFAVRRFLARFRPDAGLLAETELWPNLAAAATRAGVPLYLVNARLSERSARGYARIGALSRPLLASLAGVAAQSDADATRLRALGAREVAVTGNLKFDVPVPAAMLERGRELRSAIGDDRPVLVAASTRDGEEALVLDALSRNGALLPAGALVIIVPRHPQRFDAVAALLRERAIASARRSDRAAVPRDARVLLGDSMGEMFAYYAAADVAFVGGSLLPLGGQNLIEPIAAGTPTLIGPHTFNFAQASEAAVAAGAARRVHDADDMLAVAGRLLADADARRRMRANAVAFLAAHRGAADRLWAWLAPRIGVGGPASALQPPVDRLDVVDRERADR
ncbi:MAG: lipid IV(A) 3-deoxy-D-manno-octulosonic acid transferase, partial [Candidatus Levyibacteriota bacterium]